MRRILAGLALVLLIVSPVAAGRASISVGPSTVGPNDVFVVTFNHCADLSLTNSAGVTDVIQNPEHLSTGTSTWNGIATYPEYSGSGTYTFGCLGPSGNTKASVTMTVT